MTTRSRNTTAIRLLLGAFVLSAAAAYSHDSRAASDQLPLPAGVAVKSWQENGRNGVYVLQLIQGQIPRGARRVIGKVVSDTDCDADAQGLSHCHNAVQLPGGKQITLVNTHNMHSNRCLGGGDRIELSRVDDTWVVAYLLTK